MLRIFPLFFPPLEKSLSISGIRIVAGWLSFQIAVLFHRKVPITTPPFPSFSFTFMDSPFPDFFSPSYHSLPSFSFLKGGRAPYCLGRCNTCSDRTPLYRWPHRIPGVPPPSPLPPHWSALLVTFYTLGVARTCASLVIALEK